MMPPILSEMMSRLTMTRAPSLPGVARASRISRHIPLCTRRYRGATVYVAMTEVLRGSGEMGVLSILKASVDVQQTLARLGTSDRFSIVARDFFSRLTSRCLGYFLSRELSKHVGPDKRFATIKEHSEFNAALDLHCREASRIIKEFSGGWYGKTLQQENRSQETRHADSHT
jgi:hypothetical protein